jgi:RNA polymerase sigma-70 factor, ECF subfamily
MDEQMLVRELRAGRETAFRLLYERHSPALYAFLRHLLGRAREEADDALQDVWMRAARDLPRFREQSTFRTWLFGIAVNRCREIVRLAGRYDETPEEIDLPAPPAPLIERVDLGRAIPRLSHRYREVLILHDLYEYTHAEVAAMLGIDEGTSKSNLSRARARLRQLIGGPS